MNAGIKTTHIGMKEELTTAMHAEFTISEETDRKHRAMSLLEMEKAGLPITDGSLKLSGLTRQELEGYRIELAYLFK